MAETVAVAPQELSKQQEAEVRELAGAIETIFTIKPKYIKAGFDRYLRGEANWFTTILDPPIYEGEIEEQETAESFVRIDRHVGNPKFPASKSIMLQDWVRDRSPSKIARSRTIFVTIPDDSAGKPAIKCMGHNFPGESEFAADPKVQIGYIKKFVNAL